MSDPRHLCDELLSPHQRRVRRALPAWTEELSRALDQAGAPPGAEAVATVFNQAALVACHLGRPEDARRLCHIELRWLGAAAERDHAPVVPTLALQPIINLARLDRMLGDADRALSRLALLGALRRDGALDAPGLATIPAARWAVARAALPRLELSVLALELTETWKTCLQARRYERALEEVARRGEAAEDEAIASCRAETAVVALCRLGHEDAALSLCARRAAASPPGLQGVFELRRAEALAAFGAPDDALALARPLAARLEREAAVCSTLDGLLLLARAARLLDALEGGAGAPLARAGLAGAAALGDVPLQSELLLRLLDDRAIDEASAMASLRALMDSGYRLSAAERLVGAEPAAIEARAPAYPALVRRLEAMDIG